MLVNSISPKKSQVPSPKSQVPSPKSQVPSPKIPSPKSQVPSPDIKLSVPCFQFPLSSSKSKAPSNKFPIPSSSLWCHLDFRERSMKMPRSSKFQERKGKGKFAKSWIRVLFSFIFSSGDQHKAETIRLFSPIISCYCIFLQIIWICFF